MRALPDIRLKLGLDAVRLPPPRHPTPPHPTSCCCNKRQTHKMCRGMLISSLVATSTAIGTPNKCVIVANQVLALPITPPGLGNALELQPPGFLFGPRRVARRRIPGRAPDPLSYLHPAMSFLFTFCRAFSWLSDRNSPISYPDTICSCFETEPGRQCSYIKSTRDSSEYPDPLWGRL